MTRTTVVNQSLGRPGCLLTGTALYGHDNALPPVRVDLAPMRSFTRERKGPNSILRADGSTVCTLTLVDPDSIDTFARLVADVTHPDRAQLAAASAPAMPDGPETVHLVLSHLLSHEWHRDASEWTSKARFATTPLTVTRPVEGERREPFDCPHCGRLLEIPVASHALLRERMKRSGVILLVGLLLATGPMVAAGPGNSTALSATLMTFVVVGAVMASLGGMLLWLEYKIDRDHGVEVGGLGKNIGDDDFAGGLAEHSIALAPKK
jgi:hypothetical protein